MHGHPPTAPRTRAVAIGTILLMVSVLIGLVGSALTLGRMDQSTLSRDVVIEGPRQVSIPGTLPFRIAEPLSSGTPTQMTVGLGVTPTGSAPPNCKLFQVDEIADKAIALSWLGGNQPYMSPVNPELVPIAIATLSPGTYELRCEAPRQAIKEPKSFSVSRVLGPGDLTGELKPILLFAGVIVVAALFFLAGGITLFVGLVKRGRHKRATFQQR